MIREIVLKVEYVGGTNVTDPEEMIDGLAILLEDIARTYHGTVKVHEMEVKEVV